MHAAKIQKSDRLRGLYKDLSRSLWQSTLELQMMGHVAVSTSISELRANGKDIQCKRTGNVWRYRLS